MALAFERCKSPAGQSPGILKEQGQNRQLRRFPFFVLWAGMRLIIVLAVLSVVGCRPIDTGAPINEADARERSGVGVALSEGRRLSVLRVIDGDTFEIDGEVIRIANIDAPEKPPRARCPAEAGLAQAAERELNDVLGVGYGGATIAPGIEREGEDRYGRTLALVTTISGEDVGGEMIRRGVAVQWTGRRAEWCEG